MCLHENIRNQSSHRDFQSVNLKCELKEIQDFSKGMNLETLFKKKYSYCPLCSTFSNPRYKSDWFVTSILGNVISKTAVPQIKASIKLEKTPLCHAHAAYYHNSKFKFIILILCLIHAGFVLRSSQHYSWVVFPPNMERSTDLQVGVWTLIFNPCFNCGHILSSNLRQAKVIPVCKISGSFPIGFLKPKLFCYFSIC